MDIRLAGVVKTFEPDIVALENVSLHRGGEFVIWWAPPVRERPHCSVSCRESTCPPGDR